MVSGRFLSEFAFISLLCTLSIFLFPAVHGPYSAVHGPVTALQSMRLATRLRFAILAAALTSLSNYLAYLLTRVGRLCLRSLDCPFSCFSEPATNLRC